MSLSFYSIWESEHSRDATLEVAAENPLDDSSVTATNIINNQLDNFRTELNVYNANPQLIFAEIAQLLKTIVDSINDSHKIQRIKLSTQIDQARGLAESEVTSSQSPKVMVNFNGDHISLNQLLNAIEERINKQQSTAAFFQKATQNDPRVTIKSPKDALNGNQNKTSSDNSDANSKKRPIRVI